jgi:hypothetical protein
MNRRRDHARLIHRAGDGRADVISCRMIAHLANRAAHPPACLSSASRFEHPLLALAQRIEDGLWQAKLRILPIALPQGVEIRVRVGGQ